MVRKVSVILPAFNEAGAIGEVLAGIQAVAEQRSKTEIFEILVVDDGSSDGTAEAAEKAGARVVRHPYNIGNGASVKAGMRAAASSPNCHAAQTATTQPASASASLMKPR